MDIEVKYSSVEFKCLKILSIFFVTIVCLGCASSEDSSMPGNASGGEYDTDYRTPVDYYKLCADSRCEFNLYEGERIAMGAATWYAEDSGFMLEGAPAVMSVVDDYAAHPEVPVNCYTVRILGRWDADVSVFFDVDSEYGIFGLSAAEEEADLHGDTDYINESAFEGSFRYEKSLPANDWEMIQFQLQTLAHRGQMTFSVRKESTGDALFYFVEINGESTCESDAIQVDAAGMRV